MQFHIAMSEVFLEFKLLRRQSIRLLKLEDYTIPLNNKKHVHVWWRKQFYLKKSRLSNCTSNICRKINVKAKHILMHIKATTLSKSHTLKHF